MFYLQVSVVRNEMAVLLYGAELVQIPVTGQIEVNSGAVNRAT